MVGIVIRLITVNITPVNMVTVITMDQALHAAVKRDLVAQAVAILISAITKHVQIMEYVSTSNIDIPVNATTVITEKIAN